MIDITYFVEKLRAEREAKEARRTAANHGCSSNQPVVRRTAASEKPTPLARSAAAYRVSE